MKMTLEEAIRALTPAPGTATTEEIAALIVLHEFFMEHLRLVLAQPFVDRGPRGNV